MKIKNLILISLLISVFNFAQQKNSVHTYNKAEIIFENGTSVRGLMREDKLEKKNKDFWDIYRFYFNQNYNYIFFKESENSAEQSFKIDDVKSVILYDKDDNETEQLDKLKIFILNDKFEVVDLNRTALLPLYATGKIKLYGFTIYECNKKNPEDCSLSFFMPYLRKADESIAYFPADVDKKRYNIKTQGKIYDQTILHMATKCPKFQEYYQKNYIDLSKKERIRNLWEDATESIEKMKGLHRIDNLKTRNFVASNEMLKGATRIYLKLMDKYDELCEN